MNEPNDDFDALLEQLFSREHAHLPAEPFSSKTRKAIAIARERAMLKKRLTQATALFVLIVLSPQLIDGSAWLSTRLDELFALASSWLATPYGAGAAALVVLAGLVARWARVW